MSKSLLFSCMGVAFAAAVLLAPGPCVAQDEAQAALPVDQQVQEAAPAAPQGNLSAGGQNGGDEVINENGWQFLYWGMSEEDVRAAMTYQGKEYDGTDNRQHWFWYGFDTSWNLLKLTVSEIPRPGLLKWVRSGIPDTDFLYYDGRLFGVLIGKRNSEEYVLRLFKSMTERYPDGEVHQITDTNMVYFRHRSDHRIIVWQSNAREFGLGFFDIETINYLAQVDAGDVTAASGDTAPPGGVDPSAFEMDDAAFTPEEPAASQETIRHFPGEIWREPSTGMEFVWVAGGCFVMGQTEAGMNELIADLGEEQYSSRYASELPRHEACVDGFWMGRFEVTNREYRVFDSMHDSGYAINDDAQPVVYVSAEEAEEFAAWLSEDQDGREFRLPTEAEWEYAARGGTNSIRSWGDAVTLACQNANVGDAMAAEADVEVRDAFACNDGYAVSAPVGSFPPNNFGLHDMMGNVWEWTQDMYGDYFLVMDQRDNPLNLQGYGANRAIRGGSWASSPDKVRSAYHGGAAPSRKEKTLGFRLVMVEGAAAGDVFDDPGDPAMDPEYTPYTAPEADPVSSQGGEPMPFENQ